MVEVASAVTALSRLRIVFIEWRLRLSRLAAPLLIIGSRVSVPAGASWKVRRSLGDLAGTRLGRPRSLKK